MLPCIHATRFLPIYLVSKYQGYKMQQHHLQQWPVSCEREFSSLQGKVSVTLLPSSAVFLLCKREKTLLQRNPAHMTRANAMIINAAYLYYRVDHKVGQFFFKRCQKLKKIF
jgi:hypothetical protein